MSERDMTSPARRKDGWLYMVLLECPSADGESATEVVYLGHELAARELGELLNTRHREGGRWELARAREAARLQKEAEGGAPTEPEKIGDVPDLYLHFPGVTDEDGKLRGAGNVDVRRILEIQYDDGEEEGADEDEEQDEDLGQRREPPKRFDKIPRVRS